MSDFDWDAYEDDADVKAATREEQVSQMRDEYAEKPEIADSIARGVVQGGTLGFADEIYGAVRGGYDALTTDADLDDAYAARRDEYRQDDAIAREANPTTYMAAELGGGLLLPGGVLGKGAQLATRGAVSAGRLAAGTVAGAAAEGTLAGVGYSQSESAAEIGRDALEGAAWGAGTAGLLKGGTRVAQAIKGKGQKVAKGVARASLGVDEATAVRYQARPDQVEGASRGFEELADDLSQKADALRQRMSAQSGQAFDTLPADKTVDLSEAQAIVRRGMAKLKGPDGQVLSGAADDFARLRRLEDDLTRQSKKTKPSGLLGPDGAPLAGGAEDVAQVADARAAKNIVMRSLDPIAYGKNLRPGEYAPEARRVAQAARKAIDEQLKDVPEYARIMAGVAEDARALNGVEGLLSTREATVAGKLKRAARQPDLQRQELAALDAVDQRIGSRTKASDEIQDRLAAEGFEKDNTRGSRNVLAYGSGGYALGSGAGFALAGPGGAAVLGPVGAAVGAGVGMGIDKYGPRLAKKVLRSGGPVSDAAVAAMEKHAAKFSAAERRGPRAVVALHATLMNRDEEYAGAYRELQAHDADYETTATVDPVAPPADDPRIEAARLKGGDKSAAVAHSVLLRRDPAYRARVLGD